MAIIKINSDKKTKLKLNNYFLDGLLKAVKGNLKAVDQKILYLLVSKIYEDKSDDNVEYELSLNEIKQVHDLKHNWQDLKLSAGRLLNCNFGYINEIDKEFEMFNALDKVSYSTALAILKFKLTTSFKEEMLKIDKGYTQYFLLNLKPLKSIYSIRLYNMLMQMQPNWRKIFSDLGELRSFLGTKSSAENYANLKKILVKSQAELTKNCDRTFTFKEIKQKSKVTGIIITAIANEFRVTEYQPELKGMPINIRKGKLEMDILSFGFTADIDSLFSYVGGWEVAEYYWNMMLKGQVLYGDKIENKGAYINKHIRMNAPRIWQKKLEHDIILNHQKNAFEKKEAQLRAERLSKEADEAEQMKTENIEIWNNFTEKQKDFLCEVRNKTKSDNMPYDDIYDLVLESVANEEFKKIKGD